MLGPLTELPVLVAYLSVPDLLLVLTVAFLWLALDGRSQFGRRLRQAFFRLLGTFDRESHGAGKSFGGIFGKRAAQALTPDNQVAELYDPAVFRKENGSGQRAKQNQFQRWRPWWLRKLRSLLGRD